MPSASSRAVTSADEPAGKRTVISIGPFCGKVRSCAWISPAMARIEMHARLEKLLADRVMMSSRSIVGHDFRDFDAASFARGNDTGANDRERQRCALAVHFRAAVAAGRGGKFLQLLDEGVVPRGRNRDRALAPAPQQA